MRDTHIDADQTPEAEARSRAQAETSGEPKSVTLSSLTRKPYVCADSGIGDREDQVIADAQSRRHARETLQFVQRALREGWDIPAGTRARLPRIVLDMIEHAEAPTIRLRAIETLRAMARDNTEAAIALDKITRLDSGAPTEHVSISAALDRAAQREQRILAKQTTTPTPPHQDK